MLPRPSKPETELCEIAVRHQSDRTPSLGGHGYTPYYHSLFKDRRNEIKKVMEIGIDQGRGLRMWRDYFPNAQIYGLDIQTNLFVNEDRIQSFFIDLSSLESIGDVGNWTGRDFDIIFDDGSHYPQHQVAAANILVGLLAPKGTYIIEDVGFPDQVRPQLVFPNETIDFRLDWGIHDDRLIVMRRP